MENPSSKAIRDLGIFYCAIYVVSLAVCSLALWLYWGRWQVESLIPDLADVATVSAGAALLATILKEGVWYMVLAAMKIKEWKEQGRKEGREEGRKEGREEGREEGRNDQLKRQQKAVARFGVEVNGVLMLPQTPEVERFLAGDDEPGSER